MTRALAAIVLAFAGCVPIPARAAEGADVVRAFVEAWNAHDADAMARLLADDVVWLSIDGDTVGADVRGVPALRAWVADYWRDLPDSRSRLVSVGPGARHVQAYECANWTGKDGTPREQCSASTYEVVDGRIRRVWYFPAEPAP